MLIAALLLAAAVVTVIEDLQAPPADTATVSPRSSSAIIALNLVAPLVCSQYANAVMQGQDEGGLHGAAAAERLRSQRAAGRPSHVAASRDVQSHRFAADL